MLIKLPRLGVDYAPAAAEMIYTPITFTGTGITVTTDSPVIDSSFTKTTRGQTLRTNKGLVVATTMTDAQAAEVIRKNQGLDSFADKMRSNWMVYRDRLTESQRAWLHIKAMEFLKKDSTPVAKHNFQKIQQMMRLAAADLKYPTIEIKCETNTGKLVLTYHKEGKYPDSITIATGSKREGGIWYGSIRTDGSLYASRIPMTAAVAACLAKLADDPQGTIAEEGRKTGRCCYCKIELTDPVSVELGYGPICAKHYGLKHGKSHMIAVAAYRAGK